MGKIVTLPILPAPTGDAFLDELELLIARLMLDRIDNPARGWPVGLARAREIYLRHHPELPAPLPDAGGYLQVLERAVRLLAPAERARLRHPACNRARAQQLLQKDS